MTNLRNRIIAGDGTTKRLHEQTVPRLNDLGEVTSVFGRILDISHEMEMQKKLEYLAKLDPITSLPNSYSAQEKLNEFIQDESIKTFGLLFIELDNFHWITSFFDYKISDKVLKAITNRLIRLGVKSSYLAKETKGIFVLFIYNYLDFEEVTRIADGIVKDISKPLNIDGYELFVTDSIGIGFYSEHGSDRSTLIDNTYVALQHAKNFGQTNFQVYFSKQNITSHKWFMLEKHLMDHQAGVIKPVKSRAIGSKGRTT